MLSVQNLCDRLHREGKKITPQRRLIYQSLAATTNHPSAEAIYDKVSQIIPDVSLATVYKTLRELVEMGELQEIKFSGDHIRFDIHTDQHNHLVCTSCGWMQDVAQQLVAFDPTEIAESGFRVRQSEVILWGLCATCQTSYK